METVKQRVVAELEELRDWLKSIDSIDMSDAGSVPDGPEDELINEVKVSVIITAQHATSLIAMVQYVKKLISSRGMEETVNRSDELTAAYCDELMEDLGT